MTRYQRHESVLSQEIEGEAVLYDTRRERYFSLNETGTLLWANLQEPSTSAQLRDKLFEVYEVELEVLESDLQEVLKELQQADLVVLSEE